jgi:WD40 repeat protein
VNVEPRLRDAMRARVAEIDAPAMAERAPRPRRVWPAVAAGFAVVVVLALVIALLANGNNEDAVSPASKPHPSRIVGVTYDGRLVIVSAKDGHILHTLAADAAAANGVSVSPDGRTIYYARDTGARCGTGDPVTTVAAIPVAGGAPTDLVSNVRFPAVSPDGRSLAFTGIPNCSDAGRSILVRNLTRDTHRYGSYDEEWSVSTGTSPWVAVQSLAWMPDSKRIFFTHATNGTTGADDSLPRLLDTAKGSSTSLDSSPVVRVAPGVVCCAIGAKGPTYGSELDAGGFARAVVTVDAGTGKVARRLTCCGEVIGVDAAGRSLLIHFTDATHPGGIYRWNPGDGAPVFLGGSLFAAAWLPGT